MDEIINMILIFIAGIALGLFFFGGLWFTVRHAVGAKLPGLLIIGSFVLRTSIVLICFYLISSSELLRFLLATGGFITARFMVTYLSGKQTKKKEPSYET